jgi:hypothetical protein
MLGYQRLTNDKLRIFLGLGALFVTTAFIVIGVQKHVAQNQDAARLADIRSLLNAAKNQQVDNEGDYLENIENAAPGVLYLIGTSSEDCTRSCIGLQTNSACLDLSTLSSTGYLQEIPFDPAHGDPRQTGYYLIRKATEELEIGACQSSSEQKLSVSR